MKITLRTLAAAALLAVAPTSYISAQTSIETLRKTFLSPPNDAKPMMRWWWFGVAAEKPEILRELQQMKADNIGGVELAFVYPQVLDDPSKGLVNDTFLSSAMLENVRYAQSEARKLGLRVDVTLGSGWPYGGPAITLEEAATRLRVTEMPIPASATSLPMFKLPEGDSILSVAVVNGEPKHWDASTAKSAKPGESISPSSTPRVALFFIQSHTGQQVKRAAVGAEGWVLDPFSKQAVATHLKSVGDPLVKAFGATPPYAVFSDSLEAYGADWTPNLPAEFQKRRGYDLIPHLPELVAGGTPAAEKVRHDWGKTLTELVDENYLTQINTWATANHTKFRSQTYGDPAVTLSSQRLVALPEGEGAHWRAFSTLRWASSANHLFGNNVTSAETFTWLHSPVFRATPLDMKAEADLHFLIGTNQIIGHGWPYSAPQVGEPGWSLYASAVFNDHNPWHPVMPDVARYIQRISWLLRQGKPANQVAILLPTDDAWAHFVPGKVSVTAEMAHLISPALMSTILSAGYNIDYIDADAINRDDLRPYQILVVPATDRIPLETLRKIQQYVSGGGKVISFGHAPSLDPEGNTIPEITALSRQLFQPVKPVLDGAENSVAQALFNAARPDLAIEDRQGTRPSLLGSRDEIGFIRRKLPNADIYFLANTSNNVIDTMVFSFATTYAHGEAWNPDTGLSSPASRTCHPLHLAPYESRVFIFSSTGPGAPAVSGHGTLKSACDMDLPVSSHDPYSNLDISANWQLKFTATGKTESQPTLTDWTANPDTLRYSGEAIYSRDFTLQTTPHAPIYLQIEGGSANNPNPPATQQAEHNTPGIPNPLVTRTGPGMRAWYDPPIREAAIVFVNGQRAGSLWHPPYRLDVSKLLKPGTNHIEIHVYNTALNAWSALPPHDYKPLIEKYGDRFQMQDLDQVKPIPSGILGQIHLVSDDRK
jgi:hypothetical protein